MIRLPPISTRTVTLFPDTTLCRSPGDQRLLVTDSSALRLELRHVIDLAAIILGEQRLRVRTQPLVEPEVVVIAHRKLVGEPFVAELMVHQRIPAVRRLGIIVGIDRKSDVVGKEWVSTSRYRG